MKLRILVQNGSLAGQQFELENSPLLLGRSSECSVRFDPNSDLGVSSRHAIIQAEADGFYIVDQNSTNGTFINGQKVQKARLSAGCDLQLGYQGPHIQVLIEGRATEYVTPPTVLQTPINNPPFVPPAYNNSPYPPAYQPNPSGPVPNYANSYANPGTPPMNPPPFAPPFPPPPRPYQNPGNMGNMVGSPVNGSLNNVGATSLRQSFSSMGMYNPEKEKSTSHYLGIGAILSIGAVMAVLVLIITLLSLGPLGAIMGTILAFAPAPLYLMLFLWLDRYDPEPAWALAGAFAWGALFAVLISFIVNTVFSGVASSIVGGPAGDTLSAVISAPLVEEGTKGLGVLAFFLFLRSEFDDILDGIVYAGVIALGFATVENVLYYGRQFNESGIGIGLIFILFLRGVLAPFSHALFTSMTGIGCGIARESHNKVVKIISPIVGYILAVFLHALWNTVASVAGGKGYLLFYLIVWIPIFLIMLGVMIYMAKREAKLIKEMLVIEVARGLISKEQLELVGSSTARIKWLAQSLFKGDWKQFSSKRRFLRSITKLAFCYWHVARASQANQQTRSLPQIPKFQAEVTSLKSQIG